MTYTDEQLFDIAVEITKQYSRGGGEHPASKLKDIFEALKEINPK